MNDKTPDFEKMSAKEMADYFSQEQEKKFSELGNAIAAKADKETIEKIKVELSEIAKKESEAVNAKLKDLTERAENAEKTLKAQGERMKSFGQEAKEIDFGHPLKNQIAKATAALLMSDEFSDMGKTDFRGKTKGYTEKAVVDITDDHTGTVLLSDIRDRVRSDDDQIMPHMYDVVPKETTDGTQIVFPQFYSLTDALIGASAMYAENAEIADLEFKTKEVTASVKRIGQGLTLSKRYIKTNGLRWVQSYILNRMPNLMLTKLDFQMLFGTGSGDNLDGITGSAQDFDLSGNTYVATDFSSVADHADGLVKVTFADAHNLKNGDSLTIADSSNYNATYTNVIVISETEVLITATYAAETTSGWTGTSANYWADRIDNATSYDAIVAAVSVMQARGFNPNAIVLNPMQVAEISLIKETTAGYINVTRDAANNMRIKGIPVTELQALPPGKALIGNFNELAVAEYTPMQMSASESTAEKRKNQVVFIGEMELIFPIYNPYAFMYFDIATAITSIEKP